MQLRKDQISQLITESTGKLRATVYLPTHPDNSPANLSQDKVLFKNAIQALRRHDAYDARELDDTLTRLDLELYDDPEFWKHLDYGLAIMISGAGYQFFRLPFRVTEQLFVSDEFVISPLIIMAGANTNYYLVDINLTKPRLLFGSRGSFREIVIDDMPGSIEETIGREEYRKHLQHQRSGVSNFHGHTEEDAILDDQQKYFRAIAQAVDDYLAKKSSDRPLILAGTTSRIGNFQKHLRYRHVIDSQLVGNFEDSSVKDIFNKSNPIADRYFQEQVDKSVEKLLSSAPEVVAIGEQEIIEVARDNRVEALYIPIYQFNEAPSSSSEPSLTLELPADIYDLEPMVTTVFKQNGQIIPVAIDRYDGLDQPKALCRF